MLVSRIAAALALSLPLQAQDVQEVDWWSNRTASQNVEEVTLDGQGEYLRLGNATSGFLEGELALSGSILIIRELLHGVRAAATGLPAGEVVRLFIGEGLVHEYSGLAGDQTALEEVLVWAIQPQTNSVPYRIEFESPNADRLQHPIFLRGRVARRLSDVQIGQIRCALGPNSVGSGVVLLAMGSRSIASNNFTLTSAGGPPGELALLFYGPESQRIPLAQGYLCVSAGGTGIQRLVPPLPFTAAGHLDRQLDFTAPPASSGPGAIAAGTTWSFQAWYRDPAAGGSNLSESLVVTFAP